MSILRNNRYQQFENGTARDAFRGLPLQQFPWVLETCEHRSTQPDLLWQVEIACLEATPSGFGSKLNFKLRGKAQLSRATLAKLMYEGQNQSRVSQLFSDDLFTFEDSCQASCEGMLEELPKLGKELLKKFQTQLDAEWNSDKVKSLIRLHLRHSSPGGFGERAF